MKTFFSADSTALCNIIQANIWRPSYEAQRCLGLHSASIATVQSRHTHSGKKATNATVSRWKNTRRCFFSSKNPCLVFGRLFFVFCLIYTCFCFTNVPQNAPKRRKRNRKFLRKNTSLHFPIYCCIFFPECVHSEPWLARNQPNCRQKRPRR